jgi:glutathionylspermidine synthase
MVVMMSPAITAGAPLCDKEFAAFKRRAIFECCKWDPQVEDVCTVARFPLVLTAETWAHLCRAAEALAAEVTAAEEELRLRPELHQDLALPRRVRKILRQRCDGQSSHVRLLRFDFHFTDEGWRISECNTDVPGGYNEASGYIRLMQEHLPGLVPSGDPAGGVAEALARATPEGGRIGLVHATSFTDDRQVMVFLARELQQRRREPVLLAPDHLHWVKGRPFLRGRDDQPLDAIGRFFPCEWLPNLQRRTGWQNLLHGAAVPVCNPGTAILTQSKRFPLVWEHLKQDLSSWRRYLPETTDPRHAAWHAYREAWALKPAFGRVGDLIGMAGVTTGEDWLEIRKSVEKRPDLWVAQKRFRTMPVETPAGKMFPCIGVYTVNGRVTGAYGRLGWTPIVNHIALDAPVFIAPAIATTPREQAPSPALTSLSTNSSCK